MGYDARRQASQFRLLTAAEERELARIIEHGRAARERREQAVPRAGDDRLVAAADAARRRFMEANLGLVLKLATSVRLPAHIDGDDVIQDGMLGLERAVERFDWRRGYRFSTYATWWIRRAIQRGLENTATTIRIPAHRHGDLQAARADARTPELAALAAVGSLDSLDRPVAETGAVLADLVPAGGDGPENLALRALDRQEVRRRIQELDPTTAAAIVQRFGFDGNEPATFAQIGARLNVSGEAARRRVQRALDRLRSELRPLAA